MTLLENCRENYMNINDVVAHALDIRNNADEWTRYKLEANALTGTVDLIIYPFNGVYIESPIGAHRFFITQDGKISSVWING